MEVLILQVFVSLMLVLGSILLFAVAFKKRDFDHGDYLELRPLCPDEGLPLALPETSLQLRKPQDDGK